MITAVIFRAVSSKAQATDDKVSLETQESQLRAVASERGWTVVDVISVPGFSRDYYNYREFAESAADAGIHDPLRMFDHWNKRDFNVLMVWDGSRMGRKASIFAEVVSRTIDAGAIVYSHADGVIDKSNAGLYMAMGGYAAESELTKFKERSKAAKRARAQKGLPNYPFPPLCHTVIRDALGNALRIELTPGLERLWTDVALLLLGDNEQGITPVSFKKLEYELYQRFGHVDPRTNKAFPQQFFYKLLYNPHFWGHAAQYRHARALPQRSLHECYAFDEELPVPDGILITRNVLPPVYTGELAERVKAELRRRKPLKGSADADRAHMFTGLCVCASCMYTMVYAHPRNTHVYYYCRAWTTAPHNFEHRECDNPVRTIREEAVQDYVNALLSDLLAHGAGYLERVATRGNETAARIEQLTRELDALDEQVKNLTRGMAMLTSPEAVRYAADEINRIGERVTILTSERDRLTAIAPRTHERRAALDMLQGRALREFWQQPEALINSLLHAILAPYRLAVYDGDVVGLIPAPPRFRKPR